MYMTDSKAGKQRSCHDLSEYVNKIAAADHKLSHHAVSLEKAKASAFATTKIISPRANARNDLPGHGDFNKPKSMSKEELVAQMLCSKVSTKEINLEKLLQNLFDAKGFKTRCCAESTSRSATLIVSTPSNVKVSVQIKQSARPLTEPMIEIAKEVMTIYGTKHSLLVSLAGFTEKTLAAAKLNDASLKLWSAKDIAKEIIANYSNMDTQVRSCFDKVMSVK